MVQTADNTKFDKKVVFKIEVNDGTELVGRLVGFINEEECKAILNSDNAPGKISTSASTSISDHIGHIETSRFVLVMKESMIGAYGKCRPPSIFISPKIQKVSWLEGNARLHCKDKKIYTFKREAIE